jgi:glycosyltransferase involved in cell wall biosynthesis
MRITFFLPSLAGGGAERMVLNLIQGLKSYPVQIDLVVTSSDGEWAEHIPGDTHLIDLKKGRVLLSLLPLIMVLRKNQPDIIFSAVDHANLIALLAAILSRTKAKRVISVHQVGSTFRQIHTGFRERIVHHCLRQFYRFADQIVAVSSGVAEDLIQDAVIDRQKLICIGNPIITEQQLDEMMNTPKEKDSRVFEIVSAGRLVKEKDFSTLLRAFSLVRQKVHCRLTIYGEGFERASLEKERDQLGLKDDVTFPGFSVNLFQQFCRADLCVVSSLTEGFGNVIVESLACGVPVVATDCPGGPREILQQGQFGSLVPIQQPVILAETILENMQAVIDPVQLQERARDFSIEKISGLYYGLFKALDEGK